MNQSKCCDTCLLRNMVKPQCGNSVCPCHKTAETLKECDCRLISRSDGSVRHAAWCRSFIPTTDTSDLKEYLIKVASNPDTIQRAAEEGAKDQDKMLRRATDTSDKKPPYSECIKCNLETWQCKCPERQEDGSWKSTDTSDWESQIVSLVGEASMCWEPIPTGVFDSDEAMRVAFKIVGIARKEIETARAAAEAERPIYYPSREAFVEAMEATKAAERARLREVIAGQKITDVGYTQSMSHRGHYERGYNTALTDLLETLKD